MDKHFRLFSLKRHDLWVFWHNGGKGKVKDKALKSVVRFPVPWILDKKYVLDKNSCKKRDGFYSFRL